MRAMTATASTGSFISLPPFLRTSVRRRPGAGQGRWIIGGSPNLPLFRTGDDHEEGGLLGRGVLADLQFGLRGLDGILQEGSAGSVLSPVERPEVWKFVRPPDLHFDDVVAVEFLLASPKTEGLERLVDQFSTRSLSGRVLNPHSDVDLILRADPDLRSVRERSLPGRHTGSDLLVPGPSFVCIEQLADGLHVLGSEQVLGDSILALGADVEDRVTPCAPFGVFEGQRVLLGPELRPLQQYRQMRPDL